MRGQWGGELEERGNGAGECWCSEVWAGGRMRDWSRGWFVH